MRSTALLDALGAPTAPFPAINPSRPDNTAVLPKVPAAPTGRLIPDFYRDPELPVNVRYRPALYVTSKPLPQTSLTSLIATGRDARSSCLRWMRGVSACFMFLTIWLLLASTGWESATAGVQVTWTAAMALLGFSLFIAKEWRSGKHTRPYSLKLTVATIAGCMVTAGMSLLLGFAVLFYNLGMNFVLN